MRRKDSKFKRYFREESNASNAVEIRVKLKVWWVGLYGRKIWIIGVSEPQVEACRPHHITTTIIIMMTKPYQTFFKSNLGHWFDLINLRILTFDLFDLICLIRLIRDLI
jgi:hypothetical protein